MSITNENHNAPKTEGSNLEESLKNTSEKLTFGEELVGIKFNPSNDGDVALIKTKMAEIANLLNNYRQYPKKTSSLSALIYETAITSILEAQMMAVKYVTLKY